MPPGPSRAASEVYVPPPPRSMSDRRYRGMRNRERLCVQGCTCFELVKRATRSDRLSDDTVDAVVKYFTSETSPSTNARDCVNRPRGMKTGPLMHAKHWLDYTLTELYFKFREFKEDMKISFRMFAALRPWFVRHRRPVDRLVCVCRYHTEAREMMRALHDLAHRLHKSAKHRLDAAAAATDAASRPRRATTSVRVAGLNRDEVAAAARAAREEANEAAEITAQAKSDLGWVESVINTRGSVTSFLDGDPSKDSVVKPMLCPSVGNRNDDFAYKAPPLRCLEGTCEGCGEARVREMFDALERVANPGVDRVSFNTFRTVVETGRAKRVEFYRERDVEVADFKERFTSPFFGPVTKATGTRRFNMGFVYHRAVAYMHGATMSADIISFPPGTVWMGTDFAQNPYSITPRRRKPSTSSRRKRRCITSSYSGTRRRRSTGFKAPRRTA